MSPKQYLKHAIILVTGTGLAQLINLASYPVLTRTYSSEDFGLFSIFLSTASLVGVIACLRFDVVIQAARFAERFAALYVAMFTAAIISVVPGILYIGYSWWANGAPDLLTSILLSLCTFFTAGMFAGAAFLIKHEAYRANSISIVTRTALTVIPQVGLFWVFPNELGLNLGFVIGLGAQVAVMAWAIRKLPWRRATRRQMRAVSLRYRDYPIFDVPSTLISTLALYALNYFILFLYAARDVGFYSVAFRLAALPMGLLASSLSEVFFQKAAKAFRETGSFARELRFNLTLSTVLSVAIFVPAALIVRPVIDVYLGPGWEMTADVLIAITPMMALRFIWVSISTTPLVVGRPQWLLAANAAVLAGFVGTFAAAATWEMPLLHYLWLTSGVTALIYVALMGAIVPLASRVMRKPVQAPAQSLPSSS